MTRPDFRELAMTRIDGALAAIQSLRLQIAAIESIAAACATHLARGGTIYTCGNGGSAAEALHLAEELIGRYRSDRPPLRAVCLNADPTALTCIANDFGFDQVFARQAQALLTGADVLIVFSTSGRSRNVVEALQVAMAKGGAAIGLLGGDGGDCLRLCTHAVVVPSGDTAHVQEAHQVILHLICERLESSLTSGA